MRKAILITSILCLIGACSSKSETLIVSSGDTGIYLHTDDFDSASGLNIVTAPSNCEDFYIDDTNEFLIEALEVFQDGFVSFVTADADGIQFFEAEAPYGYIGIDYNFEFSNFALSNNTDLENLSGPRVEFYTSISQGTSEMVFTAFDSDTGSTTESTYFQIDEEELQYFNDQLSRYCR